MLQKFCCIVSGGSGGGSEECLQYHSNPTDHVFHDHITEKNVKILERSRQYRILQFFSVM